MFLTIYRYGDCDFTSARIFSSMRIVDPRKSYGVCSHLSAIARQAT